METKNSMQVVNTSRRQVSDIHVHYFIQFPMTKTDACFSSYLLCGNNRSELALVNARSEKYHKQPGFVNRRVGVPNN